MIAMKILMAVTGLVFIGYVIVHMYGNLKAFAGQEAFDTYAHHLREILVPMLPYGGVLWIARVVLLASLIGHAGSAFYLWSRAHQARPQKYVVKKAVKATLASRTMRWGGVALLAFVVFHILHLTTHTINPGGDPESPYLRVVGSFQVWWVTLIYVVAMIALALHLRHGTFSALQTLGLTGTPKRYRTAQTAGLVLAVVVAGGFVLVPLSVLAGIVS
jgi:succinate dehydrogenase / fumarate reductase cytochrome b subunit